MNKKIIALPLSILLTVGLMETASATGTVNFKGSLAGSICTIDINNSGLDNSNIDLGTIEANTLNTVGATSPAVQFNVDMTDCPTGYSNFQFQFSGDEYGSTGDFAVSHEHDDGVVIELKDMNGAQVSPNTPIQVAAAAQSDSKIRLPFTANIRSTKGEAAVGQFVMATNISVQYE
ncbi:fimbrial protein [Rahnella perminowiae]|uniref:Type 1 fimbrial protein n=1 Tax=Rahnella perminowiae TaxID=2816244 RepID=A0ABS6L3N7_9GAMM|nr:fimbrial protein [Rahnella perminowiae]UJD89503.1 type 1 fimbrial protein [Rahnella aquatilis]MBU9824038.1 type 1 fimbrial protein [Rahnella perminowiae]MBU9836218.1 type 1 fimbrial protein [Rahnella perminowiae]MCR9001297.1 type 1 fimbrial protein [Rahnella perminowiae]MCX2942007.1 fimbrial protein [Rahnella perminowiae]